MTEQTRKRRDFTLAEKKEMINAAKTEKNQSKLARNFSKKWGFEVKRTTVKGILGNKDAIETAFDDGTPAKRKRLTKAHDPKLDEAVVKWMKQARGENLPLSGDLIKEKATRLAELLHVTDFKASNGWLENFKQRHGISLQEVQGEAGAVDSKCIWNAAILEHVAVIFKI